MNIRSIRTIIIIFFLMPLLPLSSVLSQTQEQLSAILMSAGDIQSESSSDSGKDEDQTQQSDTARKPILLDLEDKDYGYTGGKTFTNPPQEIFFDEPLSYFGYDFFNNAPTTFASVKNIPIPPNYIIGPQDHININFFGSRNKQHNLVVTREGELIIPEVGVVAVAGFTLQEAKQIIQESVTAKIIGAETKVTLGELRSINIFILGEAYQPGMYTIGALSTLVNALFKGGGIKTTGSLRNIQLKRQGKVISTLDFYDLLLKGDTSNDARLIEGDVVFIPPITKTVGISGEVTRPGIYELKENEVLGDIIKFAGNLQPKANLFSASLRRIDVDLSSNGFILIPVNLNNFSLGSFELNNGDVLGIHSVVDNLKNAILMRGHALESGFFPWQEGMKIGDLIKSKDNLLSMTDLSYVLVKRDDKLNQSYTYLQVDLEEVFGNDKSDSNILLETRDEIILLPSLLMPEQITTQLILDQYNFENGQMTLAEDQWSPMTKFRKSLMDEAFSVGGQGGGGPMIDLATGTQTTAGGNVTLEEQEVRRYYEYSIYDYCTIPEDLAISIIESFGFRPKKTVPFEDLEQLSSPDDLDNLLQAIEKEQTQSIEFATGGLQLGSTITDLCRRQILDPIIDVINRQDTSIREARTVSIYGSVHFPGTYPLTNGMVLGDAVKAAGGLKAAPSNSEIAVSRTNEAGKIFSAADTYTSLSEIQDIQAEIQAMDIINLKQHSTGIKTVEITGEVYFPGTYPISENQTLGDLISRAGGLTELGSASAAVFQRQSLKEAELARLDKAKSELRRKILLTSQSAGLGQSSIDSNAVNLLTTLLTRENKEDEEVMGRLVVDIESIVNESGADVLLEDGDSLHIPAVRQSVSVIGEVFVANSHLFHSNLTIDDYISLSGGANAYADEGNIYLIKADGSIISPSQLSGGGFFRRASGGLHPGDTIVVPLEVQPFSGIRATTEITQIIYQMAIAAAAVNSFRL